MVKEFKSTVAAAILVALSVLALLALASACGDDDDGGGGPTATPADTTADGESEFDVSMGDNFYEIDGEQNPIIGLAPGAEVTFNLTNDGTAIHNMRVAGEDNSFNTSDDAVSDPELMSAGETGTLTWTAPPEPGDHAYRCDFHPDDMKSTISVE